MVVVWDHMWPGTATCLTTCRPSVLGSATKTRPPVAKQSAQCARALKVTNNNEIIICVKNAS